MARKMRDSKKKTSIHDEAIRQFRRIESALYQERRQCLEDRRFYTIAGAQWEGQLGEQFENKPQFEVNKINLSVAKIINEYRNNRISVDFISKDGVPNDKLADICDGLYRADEQDSCANEAYDNAFEEAVGGGMGAFRLIAEYEDEEDDENEKQRIRIEPIFDADASVFFDLDAKRQDKADARHCFVMYSMTYDAFKEEYECDPSSIWREIDYKEYDWYSPNLVYIAEYYLVEEKRETVHIYEDLTGNEVRYSDSQLKDDPELEREIEATGLREVRTKTAKRRQVHKYIISGNDILEDCGVIAGKHIPIIPTYGKRWYVDSIERCAGHVRYAKDVQRLKNMLTSWLAEIASLTAREKPILTPEQVSGHEWMWADDNVENYPYILVNPMEDGAGNVVPSGPIGYTKPPQIPPALAGLMQILEIDIKELLGNFTEPDQMISHVSGKAHEMLQKRIDGMAFLYMDNFAKAIKRAGEVWLEMAKDVYVEKDRYMKTVDSMNQVSTTKLLQPEISEQGLTESPDLTKASFDVWVDVGPSSASQRDATVQTLQGMLAVTQDPQTQSILQSLILMNVEGDGLSDVREYYRKDLVNKGVLQPTEEERKAMEEAAKNAQPDPQSQALLAMAEKDKAEAQKKAAETQKVAADTELSKAKTAETYASIGVNQQEAQINTLQGVKELRTPPNVQQ